MLPNIEEKINRFVLDRLKKADVAHDYSHVQRIVSLVNKLYKKTSPKKELLIVAAYLHDISYRDEVKKFEDHVSNSKKIAEKFLKEIDYFNDSQISEILEIMDSGSSENYLQGIVPKTYEAKVLQDAGILDSLGAIGIARLFTFAGHFGESIEEATNYLENNLLKRVNFLQSKKAKIMGKGRVKYLKEFVKRLGEEMK